MTQTIVIIGPGAVGKTTIGAELARLIGAPFVDLDEVADRYYAEAGQPLDALFARIAMDGLRDAHRWWQPARTHAAKRVVEDHPASVIAFGAGHSHFEDDVWFEPVRDALTGAFVVLLLPDPDPAVSERLLTDRCVAERSEEWGGLGFLSEWIRSEHNRTLASTTLYVARRHPEDVARDIEAAMSPDR